MHCCRSKRFRKDNYDNSVDNQLPKLICRMVDGALYKQYAEILPNWVQELL